MQVSIAHELDRIPSQLKCGYADFKSHGQRGESIDGFVKEGIPYFAVYDPHKTGELGEMRRVAAKCKTRRNVVIVASLADALYFEYLSYLE